MFRSKGSTRALPGKFFIVWKDYLKLSAMKETYINPNIYPISNPTETEAINQNLINKRRIVILTIAQNLHQMEHDNNRFMENKLRLM